MRRLNRDGQPRIPQGLWSIAPPVLRARITSYHIVDLKRQNGLKVGTDKSKLKVKMPSNTYCAVYSYMQIAERISHSSGKEGRSKGMIEGGGCGGGVEVSNR